VRYSFDASAIIQGWRRFYPPSVFPALWARIETLIDEKIISATEEVLVELERKDDEIHEWALERKDMFVAIDEAIQDTVRDVLKDHKKLLDTRKGRSGADPFVIALAILQGCSVVTLEGRSRSPEKRPNIPDVCEVLGVPCLSLLQMIEREGWVF
jgi:hypothetical protein